MGRRIPASERVAGLTRGLRRTLRRSGIEVGPPGGRFANVSIRRIHVPPSVPRPAVLRGDPVTIDIRQVVTAYGFSYGDGGWHPYWATLAAYLDDPSLTASDSPLHQFFADYQPRTVAEALLPEEPGTIAPLDRVAARYAPVAWTMNARTFERAAAETVRRPTRRWNMNFGPADPDRIAAEFERCVAILDSIRTHGYEPRSFPDGVIDGFFLSDGDAVRFLPTEGQHRLGALRALGIDEVVVRPRPGIAAIRRADLPRWTPRHGGPYPLTVATRLFDRYFEQRPRPGRVGGATDRPASRAHP